MNPGETKPRDEGDDEEFGEVLHHRLSRLAARLERLTSGQQSYSQPTAAQPLTDAQMASDAFAEDDADFDVKRPQRRRTDRAGLQGDSRRPVRAEKAGLDEIAAALREIDRSQPTAAPRRRREDTPEPTATEERLRSIRQRIDALKTRQRDVGGAIDSAVTGDDAANSEATISRRSEQITSTSQFNAAVAEIAARQRDIDGQRGAAAENERHSAPAVPRQISERPEPDLTAVISELKSRVEELARSANDRDGAMDNGLTELPRSAPSREQDTIPSAVERQLSVIRSQLETSANVDDLSAIAASNNLLLERVDQLLSRTPAGLGEVVQEIIHRVPSGDRFDTLVAEIDRLSERLSTIDHKEDLARIEARMVGLNEQVASGATARFEAEITGIRDAVEGLSRMLHNGSSPALTRLENRLSQISDRFEAVLASAPRADATADLFDRLETIAARGENAPAALEALASEIAELRARERSELAKLDHHIQQLASRLEEAIEGQASGGFAVAELERKLTILTERLDEVASADTGADKMAALDQIEGQLGHLSARLDEVNASAESADGLSHLEAQVVALTGRLEGLASDRETLQQVQQNLSHVETLVNSSDANSLDMIQRAARDAVQELSDTDGDRNTRIVQELREDLRELQQASQGTNQPLDAVHETLDRVVARLGSLEADVRSETGRAIVEQPVASPVPHAEAAPVLQSQPLRRPSEQLPTEDPTSDRPLSPGSNRPPIEPNRDGGRDRRADFIAAARRAAQAAAAEHGAIRQASPADDNGESEAGRLLRFRRTLSENRRPILLAAGAVVLAIAAFQFAKPLFGSSDGAESAAPIVMAAADSVAPPIVAAPPLAVDAIVEGDPEILEAPPVSRAAANVSPGAAAFIPPDGVTSPLNPQTVVAPAADAGTYAMPEESIGAVRLRVAAAQGDPAALYEVGARYADGVGVARDLAEAAIWLERAAEAGLAVAQHRLAAMYEAGLGVPEDRATALQWYSAAAEQGNILAMHNLGVMFSQGIDGPPDFDAAVGWFASAADHGIRDSQYNLGVIYARGIGVDPNLVEAYKWFAIAAAQGDSDAAARRDDVAAALTPEQLTAARASVTVWTVQSAPAASNAVEAPEDGWDVPEERVDAGDRGELVRTVQALLADHGFDPGPTDGVEGPKTRDAARAFQQAIGVPPTGVVDEALLSALANQAA